MYNNTVVAIRDLTCGHMTSDKDIQKELQDVNTCQYLEKCF